MPRLGNHEIWVAIKYEELSDFCYRCGRLGHSQIFYGYLSSPVTRLKYGPWISVEYNSSQRNTKVFQQTDRGQHEEIEQMENITPTTMFYKKSKKWK